MTSLSRPLRIAIEGNIGAGKTTFLENLENFEGIYVVPEPLDQWMNLEGHNLLKNSFANPTRYSFQFQSYVQLTRLKVWNQKENESAKVKIVERSIHSNRHVYLEVARQSGNLTDEEYKVLCHQYETLSASFDLDLDLIIYLQSDPIRSYERMVSRGRYVL